MAGYIMTLGRGKSIAGAFKDGVYSTRISEPKKAWGTHHEGTLADFVTMAPGDDIFFFQDRKIYGVGKLKKVGLDCKYLNYPSANTPQPYKKPPQGPRPLLGDIQPGTQRWLCLFDEDPGFFRLGVDMDEALASDSAAFKALRVLWKLSFIKLDDRESLALKNLIIRRNENHLRKGDSGRFEFDASFHESLARHDLQAVRLDSKQILPHALAADGIGMRHEMAIECRLLDQLANGGDARKAFGNWSYLTHQVPASPFKPVDYMDKIDVFGYRRIPGHTTISKYLVCEIKKDAASDANVDQLMKYVDWIADENCSGDYSQLKAFLVAKKFAPGIREHTKKVAYRGFTVGSHPARPSEWEDLELAEYAYEDGDIRFRVQK